MSEYPMSRAEIEKLTGFKTSRDQLERLREMGLNPWSHPETGEVILYMQAVVQNMASKSSDGFSMNLDA